MFTPRRRDLLVGGAALAGGMLWRPRAALAAAAERKFIFFFASGGWDATGAFDPHYGTEGVDMDPDSALGTAGNLSYTAGEDRPSIDRFFRRWGARACIVNGMDCHSVGHDSAAQFVMTGTSASSFADWPTILAANARGDYPLPHVVFSGPSFPGTSGAAVVRAGGGTLLNLIDGSLVGSSDLPAPQLQTPADSMVDAFVRGRVERYAQLRAQGAGGLRTAALLANHDRATELEGRRFEAGLDDLGSDILDQAIRASELMRLGLSRCAMIGIPGGWDSHGDNEVQGDNYESFFFALDGLMDHLATTPGLAAPFLIDEVVVVALSEFGRTPLFNGSRGKDHWPYSSALLVGSGVAGNRMVGKTDDELIAEAVDFSTGQPSSSGDIVGCENLGTAILSLGDLDPAQHLPDVQVLSAVLRA
jgi:uncharacterized protein (DUF1501 family)